MHNHPITQEEIGARMCVEVYVGFLHIDLRPKQIHALFRALFHALFRALFHALLRARFHALFRALFRTFSAYIFRAHFRLKLPARTFGEL